MKRTVIVVVILVFLCNFAVAGHAAQNSLEMADVLAASGDVVYLTVALHDTIVGDGMSVSFTYDDHYLEFLADSSSWTQKGIVMGFDEEKKVGVWAGETKMELTGEVCILAFRVITEKARFSTVVRCALVVKNGIEDAAQVETEARIYTECAHSFGLWTDAGNAGHKQVCELCEFEKTERHQWQNGVTAEDPQQPGGWITSFTCEICGAVRTHAHGADEQPTMPNDQETTPPAGSHTSPTKPAGSNAHDHGAADQAPDWFGGLAAVVVLAGVIGGAVYFIRKKR